MGMECVGESKDQHINKCLSPSAGTKDLGILRMLPHTQKKFSKISLNQGSFHFPYFREFYFTSMPLLHCDFSH